MPSPHVKPAKQSGAPQRALTAAEFRALVRAKGHTLASLARLWGLTRARLSQIAADAARPPHFAFALRGTPARRVTASSPRSQPARPAPRAKARQAAAAELELGEIFIVRDSPGEHLPEGEEGIVTALVQRPGLLQAQLRFGAAHYEERFEVSYLLSARSFLVRTGRLHQQPAGAARRY